MHVRSILHERHLWSSAVILTWTKCNHITIYYRLPSYCYNGHSAISTLTSWSLHMLWSHTECGANSTPPRLWFTSNVVYITYVLHMPLQGPWSHVIYIRYCVSLLHNAVHVARLARYCATSSECIHRTEDLVEMWRHRNCYKLLCKPFRLHCIPSLSICIPWMVQPSHAERHVMEGDIFYTISAMMV